MPDSTVQRSLHEVIKEGVENVIHSDYPQQLPPLRTEHRVQISKGEKCKKKSKSRSSSETDEYVDWRRAPIPAKPANQGEMNEERGCEGKAKLPPALLQRQKRRTKQGRQRPSGICRPEPKKRDASCSEQRGFNAVNASTASHKYYG